MVSDHSSSHVKSRSIH